MNNGIQMEKDFLPELWPEDPVPAVFENCSRCELCRQGSRMTWGEGNPKADIIVILDNPGLREDKGGNPFVCGTRQTLQLAAASAGLGQKDIYITYILKCRPVRKYEKEEARGICLSHLEYQLHRNDYRIALCLGDTAVRAFFDDPGASVKSTRGIWHTKRGLPVRTSYHPLAVRRRPNLYSIFLNDWKEVAANYAFSSRQISKNS
jgi:DNA polymerase